MAREFWRVTLVCGSQSHGPQARRPVDPVGETLYATVKAIAVRTAAAVAFHSTK